MSNLNNDSNTLDTAESRPRRITAALYSIDSIRKVDEHKYTKLVNSKNIPLASFPTFSDGTSLTLDYVKTSGLKFPIIIESPENLGMKMPDASLTVHQVSDLCGPSTILDVLEVSTQSERQMKLKEWADYFSLREEERDRILNVITLEIGDTDLGRLCKRPNVVNQIDWIDTVWPKELKESMEYPRVQLYCLMSVKDSYTDFHIDFGGSSVFYHILSGEKIFFFIQPTKLNLRMYEKWMMSEEQGSVFFGDLVRDCKKVHLKAGNTMIIPTGWIHAVFTPADSIVIGGNFLHGFDIAGQFAINDIETKTKVPQKYRFPSFSKIQWYACKHYHNILRDSAMMLTEFEVRGLGFLYHFLENELYLLMDPSKMPKERLYLRESTVPASMKNIKHLLRLFSTYWCTESLIRRDSELGILSNQSINSESVTRAIQQLGIKTKRKLICYNFGAFIPDDNDLEDLYESDVTDMEFFDAHDPNLVAMYAIYGSSSDSEDVDDFDDVLGSGTRYLDSLDTEWINNDYTDSRPLKRFKEDKNLVIKKLAPEKVLQSFKSEKKKEPVVKVMKASSVFDRLKSKMNKFKKR